MFLVHYFPQLCTLTFTLTRTYFSIPSKSSQTLARGNLFLGDAPRVWTTSHGTTVIFICKEWEPHQIISIPQRWQWAFMFWVLLNTPVCPFPSSGTGYSPNRNSADLEVISILKGLTRHMFSFTCSQQIFSPKELFGVQTALHELIYNF